MVIRSALVNVMTAAAQKAGRALLRDFGELENLQVSRKGLGDFVSSADLKAERIIRESLSRARPDFGFLMEEAGAVPGVDADARFIVDPLDGTSNFLHGLPHFAVSIAAEVKGAVTAGVIYDPVKDEVFWAEKGQGAYLNSSRLRVSGRESLGDAMIACGAPVPRDPGPDTVYLMLQRLERVASAVGGVRRWGAAALDLAYVAAGRYDGFWEYGLSPWDIAAGVLMVREAGGFVTDLRGASYVTGGKDIVAANAALHPAFLRLLRVPPPENR